MQGDRGGDHAGLVGQGLAGNAGAGAGPQRRVPAEQGQADGRRRGGVADSHLAQTQDVGVGVDGVHAEGDGGGALGVVHGRRLGEIAGRPVQFQGLDPEVDAEGAAQLIDRGAAGLEVGDHLHRDLGRESRDALRRDPVVAGEYPRRRIFHARRMAALPGTQPGAQFLQPAQGSGGLGQLGLPRRRHCGRRLVGAGQAREDGSNGFEGLDDGRRGHEIDPFMCPKDVLCGGTHL